VGRKLAPHHREQLLRSAIAEDVVAERGYFTAESNRELEPLGFGPSLRHPPALVLPVHSVFGGNPWYQQRPDEPPLDANGSERKYLHPSKRELALDVHPRSRAHMGDPGKTLLVTEGLKKGDALLSAGAEAVISLPGAWNWRGTNEWGGRTAFPDWEAVALNGRETFIFFDSDCRRNPNVSLAMERLGAFLGARGARVGYVYLPSDDGHKIGADDFLASGRTLSDAFELAEWEVRRPPSERKPAKPEREFEPYSLAGCEAVFREELFLPSTTALRLALASAATNRRKGDRPVWLLLIGVPGCGKTEIVLALGGLPDAHPIATLTPAALLSGTSERERAKGATGGLLRELGDRGMLLFKDFTSVLGMRHETRAEVLSAMREIYDGAWTRHLGTDGGLTLDWRGHAGFLAGVTPTIDRYSAVMGALGDRFVLLRMPELARKEQALKARQQRGRVAEMQARLAAAACGVLAAVPADREPSEPSEAEVELLVRLADFTTHARSAVEREGNSYDIALLPEPEMPARFVLQLEGLLDGLGLIGCPRSEAWRAIYQVARDSIPRLRQRVLERLYLSESPLPTPEAVEELPARSGYRALEDLAALKMVEVHERGRGNSPHTWVLREDIRANMGVILAAEDCLPENSGPPATHSYTHSKAGPDPYVESPSDKEEFSGEQTEEPLRFDFEAHSARFADWTYPDGSRKRLMPDHYEERSWERAFVERHQPELDRELLGTILRAADSEADAERQAQEWREPVRRRKWTDSEWRQHERIAELCDPEERRRAVERMRQGARWWTDT
jgi:Domain of unknown function (DUF3854)